MLLVRETLKLCTAAYGLLQNVEKEEKYVLKVKNLPASVKEVTNFCC